MKNDVNMASKKQVEDFYNQFKEHQTKLGINIRHRTIFKNLKKLGLKANSKVLEIGCGIGTVSHLILKHIATGKFIGVDISKESVEMAKKLNAEFNQAQFIVSDMSDFTSDLSFDFVVLPDVLEHIPVDQHHRLFSVLKQVTHKNSVVLINIPEPNCLNWARKRHPEKLQIIDQSLSMQDLLNNTYPNDFELFSMNPYSLQYTEPDYLSIVLKRQNEKLDYQLKSKLTLGKANLLSKF